MLAEPEAVDRATQERITDRAHRNAAAQRELTRTERAMMNGWARRLVLARSEAKLRGVDVRRELHTIGMVMKAGRTDAAIEGRIAALERRVLPRLPDD